MTSVSPLRIDAHQHFWDRQKPEFDYSWLDATTHQTIAESHLPVDLQPLLEDNQLDGSIVVQTQHCLAENDWALDLCESNPWILGVVGWVDLASDDCEQQVERYRSDSRFVGIRHVVQDEPDDFLIHPEVLRGLNTLQRMQVPFDLLVYPRQLKHGLTVAQKYPDLKIVLNHLGKPNIKQGKAAAPDWSDSFLELAKFPNVFCKLSGLATEADWQTWSPEQLTPYLETAINAFGVQRCMFGSDWPVCRLAGSYRDIYSTFDRFAQNLTQEEQEYVFGLTACRFYGIDTGS